MVLLSVSINSAALQKSSIKPIPQKKTLNPEMVSLGKMLFNDARFSKEHTHNCASCHQLSFSGIDREKTYTGFNNVSGPINTPTVLNATYNFKQFWDGRAESINGVIDDHVADKTIFNNEWDVVIQRLNDNPDYSSLFKQQFNDGITEVNVELALTTYLKTLTTPNAPFDAFLSGDTSAISDDAKNGYELFKSYGCISCHQGLNIGGNLFQKMGVYKNYFETKQFISQTDLGLYNVTGIEQDKFVFKVPSLRNVALTAPYLHDGSAKTLEDVILIMAEYQIGQPITKREANYITEFLKTLNGDLPKEN